MEELRPVNELGERHGKWCITYRGYTAYFVNGKIFGFAEDLDVDAIDYQSEYYAK